MTKIIYGSENVMGAILQFFSNAKNVISSCGDYRGPSISIEVQEYRKLISSLRRRGIDLKYITEITRENIHYCNELMKLGYEIRHLDGIKANFSVSETDYIAYTTLRESQPIPQVIYSNIKDIVIQQKYVFDSFWNMAIPAEQKIREIEEDIEPEIFDTITDHEIASRILVDLTKSVKKEALFFLPNAKSMLRIDKLGVVDYLIKASQKSDTTIIRLVCSFSDENSEIISKITENAPRIKVVNGIDLPYGMYIVDSERAFRVELKEPSADTFSEGIGIAVYSNRPSTVNFFKSVFELLWNQRMLNEQLKTNEKIQKEFINIASHEIRTPTQAIIGLSDLLPTHPEKRDDIIQGIRRNATRLQRLTNDILDVTRIESQTLQLNEELFNLNELISNILEDYKNQVNNTMVQLIYKNRKVENGSNSIFVEGDKYRLSQVICNILDNAIRFTKEGTISISTKKRIKGGGDKVTTENSAKQKQDEQEAVVTLEDTGTGIHSEILPRLFSKFATKSHVGGTGLGLFISKSIVEAHGGRMWAENNSDGIGAAFSFSLPIIQTK